MWMLAGGWWNDSCLHSSSLQPIEREGGKIWRLSLSLSRRRLCRRRRRRPVSGRVKKERKKGKWWEEDTYVRTWGCLRTKGDVGCDATWELDFICLFFLPPSLSKDCCSLSLYMYAIPIYPSPSAPDTHTHTHSFVDATVKQTFQSGAANVRLASDTNRKTNNTSPSHTQQGGGKESLKGWGEEEEE